MLRQAAVEVYQKQFLAVYRNAIKETLASSPSKAAGSTEVDTETLPHSVWGDVFKDIPGVCTRVLNTASLVYTAASRWDYFSIARSMSDR